MTTPLYRACPAPRADLLSGHAAHPLHLLFFISLAMAGSPRLRSSLGHAPWARNPLLAVRIRCG